MKLVPVGVVKSIKNVALERSNWFVFINLGFLRLSRIFLRLTDYLYIGCFWKLLWEDRTQAAKGRRP